MNRYLLMMGELSVMEVRLKNSMSISKELRVISLAFEGLQKKLFY